MTKQNILELIQNDPWRMKILETAKSLNLPDWWIGAGFIRAKVWDNLHGYKTGTPPTDIDVIYYDKTDFSEKEANAESTAKEIYYQDKLNKLFPGPDWSVTNQARMHLAHNRKTPYKNSTEALGEWVETATCVGIKINKDGKLELTAPRGIYDLTNLILRPTLKGQIEDFDRRVKEKKWLTKWPKLKVVK